MLKVIENVGVELGVLFVGEEGEIGDGSHQDVVDAGGGFDSCFSCHRILNENENEDEDETLRYENEVYCLQRYCDGGEVTEVDYETLVGGAFNLAGAYDTVYFATVDWDGGEFGLREEGVKFRGEVETLEVF